MSTCILCYTLLCYLVDGTTFRFCENKAHSVRRFGASIYLVGPASSSPNIATNCRLDLNVITPQSFGLRLQQDVGSTSTCPERQYLVTPANTGNSVLPEVVECKLSNGARKRNHDVFVDTNASYQLKIVLLDGDTDTTRPGFNLTLTGTTCNYKNTEHKVFAKHSILQSMLIVIH